MGFVNQAVMSIKKILEATVEGVYLIIKNKRRREEEMAVNALISKR